ncbi:hypothetical protein BJF78_04040 [Pseudonocardia sp. CNS-139]|nr:hypothetical protein BJF78_04040 [Pseudonocardia sp. CNS-139]
MVEHASGVTEIPSLPERVVSATDDNDLGAVLAFGFSTPWAGGAAGSTRLPGELDELRSLAPTVTVAVRDGDRRTGTTVVGRATGRKAQAAAAIDRAEVGPPDTLRERLGLPVSQAVGRARRTPDAAPRERLSATRAPFSGDSRVRAAPFPRVAGFVCASRAATGRRGPVPGGTARARPG